MEVEQVEKIVWYLVIIGAIVAIIEAIINVIGFGFFRILGPLFGIIAIPVAVLVLLVALKDTVEILEKIPIPYEWWILLIFGIVLIIFGSAIGGILIVVAGIIKIVFEKD